MLLKKETASRGCQRQSQRSRVGENRVEVEELDHLQGAPDLRPTATPLWVVLDVDETALKGCDPDGAIGMRPPQHSNAQI